MFAPVIVFVYHRLEHTRRTFEALKKNEGASESCVRIYSDGARDSAEDRERVRAVREYIRTIDGFKNVEIVEAPRNFGLADSVIRGVTETVREFGRVIVLEDDMETSPFFLRYMNVALDRFEADQRIAAIHGYAYPYDVPVPDYFLRIGADCWGWATWAESWKQFNPDAVALYEEIRRRNLSWTFDFEGAIPHCLMLREFIAGKTSSWAIRWNASLFLKGKYSLQLRESMVRNIGVDASGSHCGKEEFYDVKLADRPVEWKEEPGLEDEVTHEALRRFYLKNRLPLWRRGIRKFFRVLSCLHG